MLKFSVAFAVAMLLVATAWAEVDVEIIEQIPEKQSWEFEPSEPTMRFTQPVMALVGIPKKYSQEGLIADRSNPLLLRLATQIEVEEGEYELLVRSINATRLFVDGVLVTSNPFVKRSTGSEEPVPIVARIQRDSLRELPPGHQESVAQIHLAAGTHHVRLELVLGGKGMRADVGEPCVAIAKQGQEFHLLGADIEPATLLNDTNWSRIASGMGNRLRLTDRANRRAASPEEDAYWQRRHELARKIIESREPIDPAKISLPNDMPVLNAIDRFIGAKLVEENVTPTPLVNDLAFLRRITLDTVGVIPSPGEIEQFLADAPAERRQRVIERLLADERWADHWVGYWQDVLAENPGILKPKLNNTGPFRWWIHESFVDNKPIDRFATELIMMRGSRYGGGPAGFAMATQNDVPMAAKAHIVGTAFLGLDMKCARCHDAPYHPFLQRHLFTMAAMLERKPITLPESSSVPRGGGREPLVEITLTPGEAIEPAWLFDELMPDVVLDGVLRDSDDPRERLAALVTSPNNDRFAQVIVNRLWTRYVGLGIVEMADDWHDAEPSHAELLDYLARELVANDYDLKHVARLIFSSHTYQRQVRPIETDSETPLFASPERRRLTAEQLLDSLYVGAGKSLGTEALTFDPEARRPVTSFLNLGVPTRAWHFTSLSNERDRPALALPVTQTVVDLLDSFGWRQSRQNPLTERDDTPNVLQPLALAGGVVGHQATRLTADSQLTQLCLTEQSVQSLIDNLYLRLVTRLPDADEKAQMEALLEPGYEARVRQGAATVASKKRHGHAVSWSNHLSAEATRIKLELERAVVAGAPPTDRLDADWRERAEDVIWALINSPEFIFVP